MTPLRRSAAVLLGVYVVLLLVALFSPSNSQQSGMVVWLSHVLAHLDVPWRYRTFDRLEVVMNVLIIAPVTFLGSILRPSYSWRDWTALGFVLSGLVELAQGLLLSGRQASFSDVVANTSGALLGALVFLALSSRRRRRR